MKRAGKIQKPYGLTKAEAIEKLNNEDFKRITVSLYKYVIINNPKTMRERLFEMWEQLDCLGRIYIAAEGINAQMSVPEYNWERFKAELYAIPEFTDVPLKIGIHHDTSFYKLQIKIRKQIVADGLTMNDYDIENVGNHLSAKEWNEAMEKDDTIVVDMRNHYESEIGHFDGAMTPAVDTFREELPKVVEELKGNEDKKVLLYCTGGIRCEKASAYLKHEGFKDVNQLHGGIIDYKHQIEREGLDNKFLGSNYVFDERDPEQIGNEIISQCHQCDTKCDRHVNCANFSCNLLFLQCNNCESTTQRTCSKKCKKIVNLPEQKKTAYYKKHGNGGPNRFSKSLKAREVFNKRSPLKKFLNIFS
ncbi:MAG: rhodanese-related sulfurtransferase [Candidatus Pacebacteria bacterium]|nr:rhodanese-related sulfurtransferase [Candidatus Paceibacterota bacterium]